MDCNFSKLQERLNDKKFTYTSEFGPPRGVNTNSIKEKVEILKGSVTAANVSDLQGSNMSLDRLATSHIIDSMGLEPVAQFTCRDRNRLSLQSDLLSAHILGIRNILCITGDHTTIGDHPTAKPVFDIDSVQLLWALSKLEQGYDLSGKKLKSKPNFFKGAAVKVECDTSASYELQLIKMKKKVECGAQFFQTMPIFDPDRFIEFIERIKSLNINVPILAGIQLLKSEKMANYMNKYLPGINIPQKIINKLTNADNKLLASLDIASSIINKIKTYCNGIHIGAKGWEKHITSLINKIV